MNTQSILHVLALVAAALGLDHTDNVASAQLANKVAKFKKDNAITGDAEAALGAVLRAAETAPVSADSTRAAAVTAEHLPDAVGPKGEEGPSGPDDSALAGPKSAVPEKVPAPAPAPAKPAAPLGSQASGPAPSKPIPTGGQGPTNEPGAKGPEGEPGKAA